MNHRLTRALAATALALAAGLAAPHRALAAAKATPPRRRLRPRRRRCRRPRPSLRASLFRGSKRSSKRTRTTRPRCPSWPVITSRSGAPAQALVLTQRLISSGDKSAQVYYLDGSAHESLGQIKEATADFEAASTLEPTNSQILLTLTNLYLQTNRPADAERVAKRATTFNKDDERAWMNYGLVLAQEKKYDEARMQFETAVKLAPKDPAPIVLEARTYIEQKRPGAGHARVRSRPGARSEVHRRPARQSAAARFRTNVKDSIATYESLLADVPADDEKASVILEEFAVYRGEKMDSEAAAHDQARRRHLSEAARRPHRLRRLLELDERSSRRRARVEYRPRT